MGIILSRISLVAWAYKNDQLPVIIKYLMKIKILWTCIPPLCV